MHVPDPLEMLAGIPGSASPGIGGVLRSRVDDFLVYELPMYEPEGAGEHLYLRLRKTGIPHDVLLGLVAKAAGVSRKSIGHAGMKDARAVTEQTISVHLPGGGELDPIGDERVELLWSEWHRNKLRRGHLAGNRFIIRIREVDPLKVTVAWSTLQSLERTGVPNAFGPQRFGRRGDNHRLGLFLAGGDCEAAVELLMEAGATGKVEAGVQKAIEEGREEKVAIGQVPSHVRRLWNDALQSAIFNALLGRRLQVGTWNELLPGDLAYSHRTRRTFIVQPEDLEDPTTMERISSRELVPTGPMWGRSMRRPGEAAALLEEEVARSLDPSLPGSMEGDDAAPGTRRPLVAPLGNPHAESGVDEHGSYIQVSFELPPGAYATTVLHAVMGS
ncbi:MAG: hypothetical protein CMJ36_03755 [Phycisphaerae bacterium]|nr:hypothetical protein [Phycisphaerae bacterium]